MVAEVRSDRGGDKERIAESEPESVPAPDGQKDTASVFQYLLSRTGGTACIVKWCGGAAYKAVRYLIDKGHQKIAGLKASDLNKILLVGGSSRIPAVQEAIKNFTGVEPFKGINPDECVEVGAAIQGGVLIMTLRV